MYAQACEIKKCGLKFIAENWKSTTSRHNIVNTTVFMCIFMCCVCGGYVHVCRYPLFMCGYMSFP